MRLDGKRALITAAGQGIGLASARLFAEAGAEVIATDIRLDSLYDLPGIEVRPLDVTSPAAIDEPSPPWAASTSCQLRRLRACRHHP